MLGRSSGRKLLGVKWIKVPVEASLVSQLPSPFFLKYLYSFLPLLLKLSSLSFTKGGLDLFPYLHHGRPAVSLTHAKETGDSESLVSQYYPFLLQLLFLLLGYRVGASQRGVSL